MIAAAPLLSARSAILAVALGIGVLLVVIGALRMMSRHSATEPAEPAAGVPTMRHVVPDSQLPTDAALAAWLAMPAVLPPHEMPPVIPGPDRKEVQP